MKRHNGTKLEAVEHVLHKCQLIYAKSKPKKNELFEPLYLLAFRPIMYCISTVCVCSSFICRVSITGSVYCTVYSIGDEGGSDNRSCIGDGGWSDNRSCIGGTGWSYNRSCIGDWG